MVLGRSAKCDCLATRPDNVDTVAISPNRCFLPVLIACKLKRLNAEHQRHGNTNDSFWFPSSSLVRDDLRPLGKRYFGANSLSRSGRSTRTARSPWTSGLQQRGCLRTARTASASYGIARDVKVTQESAWFMLQRIRLAIQDEFFGSKLGGEVEVDETFIGGKARNMRVSEVSLRYIQTLSCVHLEG
jgi:hypothetical protein